MADIPRVSVIIPTYNYGHFLGEAIQSVLDQTFTDFEIIIVNDGSTDNTNEVAESFTDPRIRYIYQENRGLSAARNTGIKASSGVYIATLDSDDMWLQQNLEIVVKRLDSHPDVGLVCSDLQVYDDATGAILGRFWYDKRSHSRVNPKKAARFALQYLLHRGCFIAPQAILVRRTVFHEVGYFDESLRTHEDWDMAVRIVQRFPIETIDIPLVINRKHGVSMQSNIERMYEGAIIVLNKAIHSYSLCSSDLKIVRRRLARTHFSYGKEMIVHGNIAAGREKLLTTIRTNPWHIRSYLYLAISLLGNNVISTIQSWKQRGKCSLTKRSRAGTNQPINGEDYHNNKACCQTPGLSLPDNVSSPQERKEDEK